MRVAIVENTSITHHGQVGVALHEAGGLIDLYKPWQNGTLPEPGSFDALVVFGGEQSARADTIHPYLPALASLLQQSGSSGRATLGICLGAQLMARGFGAENHIGTAPEFGWREVELTDAGREDPLLAHLPPAFPIFQWHSDTFTLPDGATHLARSEGARMQCIRTGRASYGTQFHFEVSRAVAADFSRTFPDLMERIEPGWHAALPARTATLGVEADAHGLAIARAWVGLI